MKSKKTSTKKSPSKPKSRLVKLERLNIKSMEVDGRFNRIESRLGI